jgi:hypothetical protein
LFFYEQIFLNHTDPHAAWRFHSAGLLIKRKIPAEYSYPKEVLLHK